MIVTFTQVPTITESEFFKSTLTGADQILLSTGSISLAVTNNIFAAQGLVRQQDLSKIGNLCHPSWQVITDKEWVDKTVQADKSIVW